ncbi:type VI secretion protein, VC_A0114 family [Succinivibrio dextrinosolvens DSM 3072]|uniref:Type VI secretion protein, VC_A0114 family n=1 Tax=Succinivibrio dextrinosolvens DSM 3072 TaxID=1123324 RepID=A0A1T4VP43_9GAMM|nr:type VI secretion system baseplate subunit TssK [Succinivibrio dextrinosolvens]SKA66743.1 type VI secretion protein, VC_A0114 family [Succinivibrio dextrinosolvens DSM 3072]
MRFDGQVHWSEGLFIQPQHLQQMQINMNSLIRAQRKFSVPFDYGFYDLELDPEALTTRRVVIKRFSAVMPDGTEISMPGNCKVETLELSLENSGQTEVDIYLTVPTLSTTESNLKSDSKTNARYTLKENLVVDENTGENEIPLISRNINAFLLTDVKNANDCTYIQLCRLRWVSINAGQPSLQLVNDYMPPFVSLSKDCPLLKISSELIFQLKSAKNSILEQFESEIFDPNSLSGSKVLQMMILRIASLYAARLDSELVPGRISTFALYLELISLLSELEAVNPSTSYEPVPHYDHDNLKPVIETLLKRIRGILLRGGVSSALAFEFYEKNSVLQLEDLDERVFSTKNLFLAVQFTGNLRDRVDDIEVGDNFRLIDRKSLSDRIRGVKLLEIRNPPQYLPNIAHTLWFRLDCDSSERIWKYINEEKNMVIDCAGDLFPNLTATLYVAVDSH